MIALVLVATLAAASPSPAQTPAPRSVLQPLPLPTKAPDLLLLEAQYNDAQKFAVAYDLELAHFGTYCAKDGGVAVDADPQIRRLLLTYPVQPFPLSIACATQRLSVDADGKVTRLGP